MIKAIDARAAAASVKLLARLYAIFVEAPQPLAPHDPRGKLMIDPTTTVFSGLTTRSTPSGQTSAPVRAAHAADTAAPPRRTVWSDLLLARTWLGGGGGPPAARERSPLAP